jgi:hypothetical protein
LSLLSSLMCYYIVCFLNLCPRVREIKRNSKPFNNASVN